MTTGKLEQAARQALDMMEFAAKYPGVKSNSANLTEVSQALREALEQPVSQEPVATDMERADAYLKGYTDARRDSKDKSK